MEPTQPVEPAPSDSSTQMNLVHPTNSPYAPPPPISEQQPVQRIIGYTNAARASAKKSPWLWIGGGVTAVVLLCCCGIGVIAAATSSTGGNTSGGQAQARQQSHPHVTPTATKPPMPTTTLTAAQQEQKFAQHLQSIANNAASGDCTDSLKVSYDTSTQTVNVICQLPENLTSGMDQTEVKVAAFDLQKAFWTTKGLSIQAVDVALTGPVTDQYGNNSIGKWGEADLTAQTATLFNWNNLDYDSAWGDYDYAYVNS